MTSASTVDDDDGGEVELASDEAIFSLKLVQSSSKTLGVGGASKKGYNAKAYHNQTVSKF